MKVEVEVELVAEKLLKGLSHRSLVVEEEEEVEAQQAQILNHMVVVKVGMEQENKSQYE